MATAGKVERRHYKKRWAIHESNGPTLKSATTSNCYGYGFP
ncbi:MAG TPA: hypothetical protein VHT31_05195 [Candidatus Acidoferrum sp.]|nr:hypothetical protein [Candidatus Acidoferrum sp.]